MERHGEPFWARTWAGRAQRPAGDDDTRDGRAPSPASRLPGA
ncbi:hypothetical protein GWL_20460 [Herbaspirillum sp. GW103]|nr:hypothetical protein GWL_20460 [Herbaspirillum sp. GW103]